MDLGIVHPVPLAVSHVVADLHVLDALRHRESGRAHRPTQHGLAAVNHQPRRDIQHPLKHDRVMDVSSVVGAEGGFDGPANRVQLDAKRFDVGFAEMGVASDLAACHVTSPRVVGARAVWSSWPAPYATIGLGATRAAWTGAAGKPH